MLRFTPDSAPPLATPVSTPKTAVAWKALDFQELGTPPLPLSKEGLARMLGVEFLGATLMSKVNPPSCVRRKLVSRNTSWLPK